MLGDLARWQTAVEGLPADADTSGQTLHRALAYANERRHEYATLEHLLLALTEDEPPTIRPYYEERWAELPDSQLPVGVSLAIVDGVHTRLIEILRNMSEEDFAREFVHPETGNWTIEKAVALYAWHSRHHNSWTVR